PGDVEPLIEAVYAGTGLHVPAEDAWGRGLAMAEGSLRAEQQKHCLAAKRFLVSEPVEEGEILYAFNQQLEEDDPEAPADWRACTRQAEPSVSLVFLYDLDGK